MWALTFRARAAGKCGCPRLSLVTAMSVFLNNFNLDDRGPGIFALNGSTAKPVRWDLSQVMVVSIHSHSQVPASWPAERSGSPSHLRRSSQDLPNWTFGVVLFCSSTPWAPTTRNQHVPLLVSSILPRLQSQLKSISKGREQQRNFSDLLQSRSTEPIRVSASRLNQDL